MQGMMKQIKNERNGADTNRTRITEFVGAASNDLVKITMTINKKVTNVVIRT